MRPIDQSTSQQLPGYSPGIRISRSTYWASRRNFETDRGHSVDTRSIDSRLSGQVSASVPSDFAIQSKPLARKAKPPHIYSGPTVCFLPGSDSRRVDNRSSAPDTTARVSAGSITASTKPRSAAWYGVRNRSA
jgi:hypothetical protein